MEEKKPKITIPNIISFFQGNIRMLGDRFGQLPQYKKEQVLYRMEICKDTCVPKGKCKHCGCSVPGKLYSSKSCNKGELFPDLMSPYDWEMFKKENNIKIKK